jgi:flagellar motor protein MotB
MSVRLLSVLALAATVGGCATVSADKYARDMGALRTYNDTLERRNQELESQNQGISRQLDDATLARTSDELYGQIARQLQAALATLRNGETDGMSYNPKTGAWEMGTDLLFDSGSPVVSAKGREILKKFADAHKGRSFNFRIVGHTDRAPIVKPGTQKLLDTDTNMELSARRAIAVMGVLKDFGIPESSFAACEGLGNRQPCAPNDRNAANMKKNRRVEIYVLSTAGELKTSAEKPARKEKAHTPKKDTTTK